MNTARCFLFTSVFLPAFAAAEEPVRAQRAAGDSTPIVQLAPAQLDAVSLDTPFALHEPGAEAVVAYERYGVFQGLGTENYKYAIKDPRGLALAAGEGVFPNTIAVLNDPLYQKFNALKQLNGSHWDFTNIPDLRKSFFKWATAQENPGVKQYFTAFALERLGQYNQAVKAYHACLVHFPGAYGMTFWNSPWYVGPAALDRIQYILRAHPELGLRLDGARADVINGTNGSIHDDRVACDPGRFVRVKPEDVVAAPQTLRGAKTVFKGKKIRLLRFANGHYQLRVNGAPYTVRGISYQPNRVGLSPDNGTLKPTEDWMTSDINKNGLVDAPFEAWVDANRNNAQDPGEKPVGDFALMRDMGVNTLRFYHHSFNREMMDVLYSSYGIRVLLGDLLGAYTVGSGADWYKGTDYEDPVQQERMMASVKKMVMEYKDHPGVLMWVLGNENVYGVATNAAQKPAAFFAFANKAARWIKSVDKNHPVALANGDVFLIEYFAQNAPDIDVFGCNAYRGDHGFGQSLWGTVKRLADKPVLITEFGAPARHSFKSPEDAEALQAAYVLNGWKDIEANSAGRGFGNALGGVVFSWVDEWWKAGPPPQHDPAAHDTVGQWQGPFPDGWMYEEWLGITSQGDGKSSPYQRQLRKAYFVLRDYWRPRAEALVSPIP